jgi:hypothetical protein
VEEGEEAERPVCRAEAEAEAEEGEDTSYGTVTAESAEEYRCRSRCTTWSSRVLKVRLGIEGATSDMEEAAGEGEGGQRRRRRKLQVH